MFILISYDIVHDRRRKKVMEFLKGFGSRVQYSVFECDLTAKQIEKVMREVRKLIDLDTDSVRCYLLDTVAVQRIQIIGIGKVTVDPPYYMVGGSPREPP